ncbi:tyrosinase family oxidase copper chaperone, partial [Streptomyces griseoluteus]|uniref:tyrosinase family oxidase copper chaperone n=1 Tax=Streptomyces griseoluteus TaxID=29306 RepID=UPI00331D1089
EWQITVDGRPLHLMRRADGTWMSMVDHYTSYARPSGRRGPARVPVRLSGRPGCGAPRCAC